MSDHIAVFGDYDETLIVAERIVSATGILALDRANRPIAPPAYEIPQYAGSMVGLDNGITFEVPHSPGEVMKRRHDAIMRGTMMPDG